MRNFWQTCQPNGLLGSWFLFGVFLKLYKVALLVWTYEKVIWYAFVSVFLQLARDPAATACVFSASTLERQFFLFHSFFSHFKPIKSVNVQTVLVSGAGVQARVDISQNL